MRITEPGEIIVSTIDRFKPFKNLKDEIVSFVINKERRMLLGLNSQNVIPKTNDNVTEVVLDSLALNLLKLRSVVKETVPNVKSKSMVLLNVAAVVYKSDKKSNTAFLSIDIPGIVISNVEAISLNLGNNVFKMAEFEASIIKTIAEVFDPSKNGSYMISSVISLDKLNA